MNYQDQIRDRWQKAHVDFDVTAVSGRTLEEHLQIFSLPEITKEQTVLCVGIGNGIWVKQASERAKEVWAIDISAKARSRVTDCATAVTPDDDLPEGKFDLAISLWVAPHMNDDDLAVQIMKVISSLKPSGLFAIHYNEPIDQTKFSRNNDTAGTAFAGNMLRTRGTFMQMVKKVRALAELIDEVVCDRGHGTRVYFHLRKRP